VTLDGITLPSGLIWSDEFGWTPVEQNISTAMTGLLIVQEAAALGGRPVTFTGTEDGCWCARETVASLYALMQTAGRVMTLVLDDTRSLQVMWSRADKSPIQTELLWPITNPSPQDLYVIKKLAFIQVSL